MGFYKSVDVNKEYSYDEIWDMYIANADYKRGDVVGIVDLDVMLFRVASACQTTHIDVTRGKTTKRFGTRTEFKQYCKFKDLNYDTFSIVDGVEAERHLRGEQHTGDVCRSHLEQETLCEPAVHLGKDRKVRSGIRSQT